MRRMILFAAVTMMFSACFHKIDVSGTVLDSRTKMPVAGAEIVAGEAKTTTDSKGKFRLTGLAKDAAIRVTAKNYEEARKVSPTEQMQFTLDPIPVTGTVTSNLEGQAVTATIVANKEEFQTRDDGSFEVFGVGPGDDIVFRSPGYEEQTVKIPGNRVEMTLLADPTTTLKQLVKWQANRNYDKYWEWAHPDSHNFISKEELSKGLSEAHAAGFALVSVDIHEVTFTTWDEICKKDGKVVFQKTYPDTATLRVTNHYSLPGGGGEDEQGVNHLVKTPEGKWGFFPSGTCD